MNCWAVEPPADPYFDRRLNAWIVSRYQDVAAALREPALTPALARSTAPAAPIDAAVHADFRTRLSARWRQRSFSNGKSDSRWLPIDWPMSCPLTSRSIS